MENNKNNNLIWDLKNCMFRAFVAKRLCNKLPNSSLRSLRKRSISLFQCKYVHLMLHLPHGTPSPPTTADTCAQLTCADYKLPRRNDRNPKKSAAAPVVAQHTTLSQGVSNHFQFTHFPETPYRRYALGATGPPPYGSSGARTSSTTIIFFRTTIVISRAPEGPQM